MREMRAHLEPPAGSRCRLTNDMNNEHTLEELLRWRLARADGQKPRRRLPWRGAPAGIGAALVELVLNGSNRCWSGLRQIQMTYSLAMAEPGLKLGKRDRLGFPVLLVRGAQETECIAHLLYLNVREGRPRLRLALDASSGPPLETWEAVFISEKGATPLFSAAAVKSVDHEYRIEGGSLSGLWPIVGGL